MSNTRMTEAEYKARHAERYRKVFNREMTLDEALAENDADWHAWREYERRCKDEQRS